MRKEQLIEPNPMYDDGFFQSCKANIEIDYTYNYEHNNAHEHNSEVFGLIGCKNNTIKMISVSA